MLNFQQEQADVVRTAIEEAGQGAWSRLRVGFVRLGAVTSVDFMRDGPEGSERVVDTMIHRPFRALREAMADEHGTWFSASVEVQRDGRYSFAFNYDELPTWGGERAVLSETLVADLMQFPRPWGEIPDWHPVKQDYTEESWADETRVV